MKLLLLAVCVGTTAAFLFPPPSDPCCCCGRRIGGGYSASSYSESGVSISTGTGAYAGPAAGVPGAGGPGGGSGYATGPAAATCIPRYIIVRPVAATSVSETVATSATSGGAYASKKTVFECKQSTAQSPICSNF